MLSSLIHNYQPVTTAPLLGGEIQLTVILTLERLMSSRKIKVSVGIAGAFGGVAILTVRTSDRTLSPFGFELVI